MIYAFRRGNFSQSLEEHIDDCLKAFYELKNTRLWSNDLSETFTRRVIVFHDVGKVLYQNRLSFSGHEFASAYVFWKVFERELGEKDELLYLFPIIFHHHAMNVKKRLERFKKMSFAPMSEETLEELRELIKRYESDEIAEKTVEALGKLNALQVAVKVRGKIEQIWRVFYGNFARKALRLLLITVICDYIGAKSRGAPTSFGRVLSEFHELYAEGCF